MNLRWFLYVIAFLISIVLMVFGVINGDAAPVLASVAIGAGLFVSRKYIQ